MIPPPTVLGKYQLVRKLAAGGMAEVFLARAAGPMGFEKQVVVKRILPHLAEEESFISMFLSEARLAAQLNHPNVVQVFDFGQADGTFFLVMEFIDGVNLRALFRKAFETGTLLDFAVAAKLVSLACEGLAFAHDFVDPATGEPMGLVHRDVSPDNILVARNGSVKVVDFGIAKAANQTHLTKTGTVKGKFAYMPPEQLTAQSLDKRADVFALGVVLYELIAGKKPFDASNEAALVRGIMYEAPTPASTVRPDMPEALQAILDKALAKDREQRYQDCRELQTDLERFIVAHGQPVSQYQLAQVVQRLAPAPPQPVPTPTGPSGPPIGAPPASATIQGDEVDLSTGVLATPPPAEEVLLLTPKPQPRVVPPPPPVPTGVSGSPFLGGTLPGDPRLPPPGLAGSPAPSAPPPAGPGGAVPFAASPTPSPAPVPWPTAPPQAPTASGWQAAPPGQPWGVVPASPSAPPWDQLRAATALDSPASSTRPSRPVRSRAPMLLVLLVATVVGSGATVLVLRGRAGELPPQAAPTTALHEPPAPEVPPAPAPVDAPTVAAPTETPPPVALVVPPPVEAPPPVVAPPPTGKTRRPPTTKASPPPKVAPPPVAAEVASVEFRVRPFGAVWVDGKFLGETPFAPASLPVGAHQVRVVNRDLGREVSKSFDVKPGANVFRHSFEE